MHEQAVKRMVDAAFKNCDITHTGKLFPLVALSYKPLYCIIHIGNKRTSEARYSEHLE